MEKLLKEEILKLPHSLANLLVLLMEYKESQDLEIGKKIILDYAGELPLFIIDEIVSAASTDEDLNDLGELINIILIR